MRTIVLYYTEFMEMFEPSIDCSAYKYQDDEEDLIEIKRKEEVCHPRHCAFLWKPTADDYNGKWQRKVYNGSSLFAMWWCQVYDCDDEFSEEE